MEQTYPNSVISISKIISNFFNPFTSLIIYFIYSSSIDYTVSEAIHRFLPILLLTVLPIVVWIVWNVKKGRYTNMDVSNRNQRKSLYFFIAGCMMVYLLYDYYTNDTLDLIMFFLLILLWVLQFSNYFIKSSMHTAFNVYVAALFFYRDPMWGLGWLIIAALVGVTRVILKRHSVKEVLTGGSLALIVSFIYLYFALQTNH